MMSASNLWTEVVAGSVAGLTGLSAVYPLDTVKMRLQTYGRGTYSSSRDVLVKMTQAHGVASLYRGLLSPAIGMGVIFGTSFTTYGATTRWLRRDNPDRALAMQESMLAGFLSGITSSVPRSMFERVKSVMQVAQKQCGKAPYASSVHCALAILREQGVPGLFRGLGATCLREGPQQLVYFPSFELGKRFLYWAHADDYLPSACMSLLPGAMAGVITWMPPIYCADVVKSRWQAAPPGEYSSFWNCAVRTYREESRCVWTRGLGIALLRAAPLHATVFCVYELVSKQLKQH